MRNTVFFLAILLVSGCALIVTLWAWPNEGTATYGSTVAPVAMSPDQGSPAAPPSSSIPASAKVASVARPVHGFPRTLGAISSDPGLGESVAFVVSNPYRPHWIIER